MDKKYVHGSEKVGEEIFSNKKRRKREMAGQGKKKKITLENSHSNLGIEFLGSHFC